MKSTSATKLTLLDSGALQKHYFQGLGFTALTPTAGGWPAGLTALTLAATLLRIGLWSFSEGGNRPVHILRLLHAAQHLVAPGLVWPQDAVPPAVVMIGEAETDAIAVEEQQPDVWALLRAALEELESLGDVAELPQGRWLPAPLRVVELPEIGRWVLLGGLPNRYLPPAVQMLVEHNGAARLLTRHPADVGFAFADQPLDDWCHRPDEQLIQWTQNLLNNTDLQPYETTTAFEYYLPQAKARSAENSSLQYYRWREEIRNLPNGRYLARRQQRQGPIYYSLVEIQNDRIVRSRALDPSSVDLRRLLYGLDALAKTPVRAELHARRDGTTKVILRNELPRAEYRLFTALGQLCPNPDGHYYPRVWRIRQTLMPQVHRVLTDLGVMIV